MKVKWRRLVAGVAMALVVVIGGIVTWGVLRHADSGWYSAWASAGSTVIAVLALIAASVAAVATVETNRNQSEQLNRLEESQKADRASKFAVWRYKETNSAEPSIYFHNAGPLPVYAVEIFFLVNGNEHSKFVGTLPPTNHPTYLPEADDGLDVFIGRLAIIGKSIPSAYPEGQVHATEDAAEQRRMMHHNDEVIKMRRAYIETYRHKGLTVEISVEFSDGESNWRRHATGRLEPVKGS
jgi:hypothetical protein